MRSTLEACWPSRWGRLRSVCSHTDRAVVTVVGQVVVVVPLVVSALALPFRKKPRPRPGQVTAPPRSDSILSTARARWTLHGNSLPRHHHFTSSPLSNRGIDSPSTKAHREL